MDKLTEQKYNELIRNVDVKVARVEDYGDYEFFSTGDIFSHKTNKFLGVNKKDTVRPSLYLYNDYGRICVSRGHVLGELFLSRTDENQNIVSQIVKGNDYSIGNLKWAIQAEVSARNLKEYLRTARENQIKTDEVDEECEEQIIAVVGEQEVPVALKKYNTLNIWTVLFSIIAVALAYKITR